MIAVAKKAADLEQRPFRDLPDAPYGLMARRGHVLKPATPHNVLDRYAGPPRDSGQRVGGAAERALTIGAMEGPVEIGRAASRVAGASFHDSGKRNHVGDNPLGVWRLELWRFGSDVGGVKTSFDVSVSRHDLLSRLGFVFVMDFKGAHRSATPHNEARSIVNVASCGSARAKRIEPAAFSAMRNSSVRSPHPLCVTYCRRTAMFG